jgi:arginine exporter protein ArgO
LIIGLVAGLITGYLLSMPPMGPTNILVISQGLRHEIKYGVAVGAGAGFMDMIYIIISYGGYALIKGFIPDSVDLFFSDNEMLFKIILTFVGCVVVGVSGFKLMRTKVPDNRNNGNSGIEINKQLGKVENKVEHTKDEITKILHTDLLQKDENSLFGGFLKGAFLCLSSVTIPASWFALTGYMKSYGIIDSRFITGLSYSVGVLAGTTFWFWTLVKVISNNTHRVSPKALSKINLGVGIMLIILSIFLLYKAVYFLILQCIK